MLKIDFGLQVQTSDERMQKEYELIFVETEE